LSQGPPFHRAPGEVWSKNIYYKPYNKGEKQNRNVIHHADTNEATKIPVFPSNMKAPVTEAATATQPLNARDRRKKLKTGRTEESCLK